MSRFSILVVAVLALAAAEAPDAKHEQARAKLDQLIRTKGAEAMVPESPGAQVDAETQKMYTSALREYYSYRITGLRHRGHVFEWQLLSSKIIFFTVLLLVLSGIYFASVQFHVGLKDHAETQTQFEASLTGIKVVSPVLGVIILVISLAFFYCYLVYVYPIQEAF